MQPVSDNLFPVQIPDKMQAQFNNTNNSSALDQISPIPDQSIKILSEVAVKNLVHKDET